MESVNIVELFVGLFAGGVVTFAIRGWFEKSKNISDQDKSHNERLQELEKDMAVIKKTVVTQSDVEVMIDKRIAHINEKLTSLDMHQKQMNDTLIQMLTEFRMFKKGGSKDE